MDLRTHPQKATSFGDYRYNDRLDPLSLGAIDAEHRTDLDFIARLRAIPTTGFPEQDALSHEVLLRSLQQRTAHFDFKDYERPVNQISGPQVSLADLPLAMPFDSVKQYEAYLARLHQIPGAFTDTEQVLRAGMRDQLMPVRFLLEKVPAQCAGVIKADPFLLPLKRFPAGFSAADRDRLGKAITAAVNDEVLPAYHAFGEFIRTEYAPQGRATLAATSLPGGKKRYLNDIRGRTTVSSLTPDQIHDIGLKEIERIEAEMSVIARREGFVDLASYRAALKTDPRYKPASAEQILEDFRKYIAQMQPRTGGRFLPPIRRCRRTDDSVGGRSLHCVARTGPVLQAGTVEIPGIARSRAPRAGGGIRHPPISRRNAERRCPAARSVGLAHRSLDPGAEGTCGGAGDAITAVQRPRRVGRDRCIDSLRVRLFQCHPPAPIGRYAERRQA